MNSSRKKPSSKMIIIIVCSLVALSFLVQFLTSKRDYTRFEDLSIDKKAIHYTESFFDDGPAQAKYDESKNTIVIQPYIKISTNEQIYYDAFDSMKKLRDLGFDKVTFQIVGAEKDIYGNIEDKVMIRFSFTRDLVNRIDWENFSPKNIPDVCDDFYIR